MQTREIPRADWSHFFDGFSGEHAGWLVRMEILGSEIGAQVEARELPLAGISADPRENTIWVTLGKEPAHHITHSIQKPTHVRVEQTEEGAHHALQIESEDGLTTLVRFRTAIRSDQVDGIVP